MKIEEEIEIAMGNYERCKKEDFKCLASYWGGYIEALQRIKDGIIEYHPTEKGSEQE